MKVGLVLEGGGLRASYTIGVLDCLMDRRLWTDYVIGVSAGACHGASYVARQRGRSRRINTNYIKAPRYISIRNLITTGSLFGMDFMFNKIPKELEPFDYDTYLENPCDFVIGVTDINSGQPVYFPKSSVTFEDASVLQASSSLPLVSKPVEYDGGLYMDGGIADPIPVKKAFEDGCDKVIVVLTRDRNFVKDPEGNEFAYRRAFRNYPKMTEAIANRHIVYTKTQDYLNELEEQGKAFVLAPEKPLTISRFETNLQKLDEVYQEGYMQTAAKKPQLCSFTKL